MYAMNITSKLEIWIPLLSIVLLWVVMQWHGKLPSVNSIAKFVAIINSRGGNIVILLGAAFYFFKWSMYLFMDLLSMVRNKTIAEDNAFALMAIQFVTTGAFGGAMGALLKTMTGESSTARKSDNSIFSDDVQTNTTATVTTVSSTVPLTNATPTVTTVSSVLPVTEHST